MKLGELLLQDEFLTVQQNEFKKFNGYFNFKIESKELDQEHVYFNRTEDIPTEFMFQEILNINIRPNIDSNGQCNGAEIKINIK